MARDTALRSHATHRLEREVGTQGNLPLSLKRAAAALCALGMASCCSQVEFHRLQLAKPNPTSLVLPVPVETIDRCWKKYDLLREGADEFDVPGRGQYTVLPSYRHDGAVAGSHGAVLESLGGFSSDIYVDDKGRPLDYSAKFVVRVQSLGPDQVRVTVDPVYYSIEVGMCSDLFSHAGQVINEIDVPAPTTDPYRIIRHLAKCAGVELPRVRLPPPPHIPVESWGT